MRPKIQASILHFDGFHFPFPLRRGFLHAHSLNDRPAIHEARDPSGFGMGLIINLHDPVHAQMSVPLGCGEPGVA
jgi:hypothetical protein